MVESEEKQQRRKLLLEIPIEQNGVTKKEKNIGRNHVAKENKVKITRDRTGRTYFWCTCQSHMVSLWWDDKFEFDMVELSFWDNPGNYEGWRQKLAHIWRIIRYGTPYADHISFDSDECELFIETLKEYVVKAKEAKAELKHKTKENNGE